MPTLLVWRCWPLTLRSGLASASQATPGGGSTLGKYHHNSSYGGAPLTEMIVPTVIVTLV